MKISLQNLGKRFNREWLFRHFDYQFHKNKSYAITGPNGSGKSTLLQVIAGYTIFNEGKISFNLSDIEIPAEKMFEQVSIAAPYLELIEEMNLKEFLNFHSKMKPMLPAFSFYEIATILGLAQAVDKEIRYYSSGMKQRLKLGQAIFSDVPVVLLDEPCTNLDSEGIELYHSLVEQHCKNRVLIISSNDVQEYGFCDEVINISSIRGEVDRGQ